jgi:hypothetical protein
LCSFVCDCVSVCVCVCVCVCVYVCMFYVHVCVPVQHAVTKQHGVPRCTR